MIPAIHITRFRYCYPLVNSRVPLLPTNNIPTSQYTDPHMTCMIFVTLQLQWVTYTKLILLLLSCTTIIILYPPNRATNLQPSLIQYHRLAWWIHEATICRTLHSSLLSRPTSVPADIAPHYLRSSTGSRQQAFAPSVLQRSYTDVDRYSSSHRQRPNDSISLYSFQSGDSDDYSGDYSTNYPAREYPNEYPSNYPQYYSLGNPNSYPTRSPNGYPNGYPYAYYRNEDSNGYYNSSSEIVVNDYPTDYRNNYASQYPASYVNDPSNVYLNEYQNDYPGNYRDGYPHSYQFDYPGNYQSDNQGNYRNQDPSNYRNEYQSNYRNQDSINYRNDYPNNYRNEYPDGYQNRYPTAVSSSNRSQQARKDPSASRYAAFLDHSFASLIALES